MNTWKWFCKELSRNGNALRLYEVFVLQKFNQVVEMCSLERKRNVGQFCAVVGVTLVVVYGNRPFVGIFEHSPGL